MCAIPHFGHQCTPVVYTPLQLEFPSIQGLHCRDLASALQSSTEWVVYYFHFLLVLYLLQQYNSLLKGGGYCLSEGCDKIKRHSYMLYLIDFPQIS